MRLESLLCKYYIMSFEHVLMSFSGGQYDVASSLCFVTCDKFTPRLSRTINELCHQLA